MLEMILKLYTMYMATDVRSPVPHLFGPPGCGKSTVVKQAADMLGVNLHTINVSRISPLELEGVQMPVAEDGEKMALRLLHATQWTQIQAGDIVLYDEFLRGFPEVYNGMLDVFTAREVGGFVLPQAFFIAASNSTIAYDKALEDRLLHLPVPDPRKKKTEAKRLGQILVDALGLLPSMVTSFEMQSLIDTEVKPMFDILDNLSNGTASQGSPKGRSIRNLIGQALLREVQAPGLIELIKMNNQKAIGEGKYQYVFFLSGKDALAYPAYEAKAEQLKGNPRLTSVQATNLDLNVQLIELERVRNEKGTPEDDEVVDDPFLD